MTGGAVNPIQIHDLTKRFDTIAALDNVTFDVAAGRVTGFLGRNGSGKSTTMKILLGLSSQTSGTATFWGRRYDQIDNPIRRVGAAIDPQTMHPARSGFEHLKVIATAAGIPHRRVDAVLSLVGLEDARHRRVGTYSMGMRQRLTLAAALIGDPEVLLLDEPLNGLDPDGINWVRTFVRDLAAEGRTVLLSSHLLAEVANTVDDVVVIERGRIVAASSLADLTGGPGVVVRTHRPNALFDALITAGLHPVQTAPHEITTTDVSAERVGQIAADNGLPISALNEVRSDLESVFHTLTTTPEATQ